MGQHLSANDVVPALKPGIDATPPPGTGEDLVTVGSLRLRGFELQLGRMLDGRRTAAEVIDNARELGLPLSLDALEDFIARLQGAGLLVRGQRPPRLTDAWQGAARDLYRDAVRSVREGEFDQARVYLDSMLRLQPATNEAVQLRRWIDSHPDPNVVGRTFVDVYLRTVNGWANDRPTHLAAELRDTLRGSWWLPLGVLTALGFLVVYALLPVSHRIFAAAELTPTDGLLIAAPAAGTVDEILVRDGDRVAAGAPLALLDVKDLRAMRADLAAKLEALRAPLRVEVGKTADGTSLGDSISRAETGLRDAKAPDRPAAERQLELAEAELDKRIPPDAPGAKEASGIAQELAVLDDQLAQKTVRSQYPGVVKRVEVEPGQSVRQGDTLLELEGRGRMRVEIRLPKKHAQAVAVGTPVTVHIAGQAHSTRVDAVNGQQIVVEIANADGRVAPGPIGVQVDLPPSSLIQRVRH